MIGWIMCLSPSYVPRQDIWRRWEKPYRTLIDLNYWYFEHILPWGLTRWIFMQSCDVVMLQSRKIQNSLFKFKPCLGPSLRKIIVSFWHLSSSPAILTILCLVGSEHNWLFYTQGVSCPPFWKPKTIYWGVDSQRDLSLHLPNRHLVWC